MFFSSVSFTVYGRMSSSHFVACPRVLYKVNRSFTALLIFRRSCFGLCCCCCLAREMYEQLLMEDNNDDQQQEQPQKQDTL